MVKKKSKFNAEKEVKEINERLGRHRNIIIKNAESIKDLKDDTWSKESFGNFMLIISSISLWGFAIYGVIRLVVG